MIYGQWARREPRLSEVAIRIKSGLSKAEYKQFTVVIILNVVHRVVGMVVDSVSDVPTILK